MMEMKIRVLPDGFQLPSIDARLDLAVDIALTTALRESEVLSLRIEQFRGLASVLKVQVKGGRTESVYFPVGLRERVKRFITDHRTGATSGWIFTGSGRHVSRMARSSLVDLWHKAQGIAGIPREDQFRFHDLRHTAITRYWEDTRDVVKTKVFARHRNVQTTMIYTHVRPEEVWQDIERLYQEG